ncbi:MAG: Fic family protein [Candidatus Krumholzibacteria bacterium]|nr:Fic family protein [Candidatus Krumholzibacteria bacterium]
MKSLATEYLDGLSFSDRQMASLAEIGSFQGKQALYGEQLPDILKAMRKIAQVESAESSNRIEGIEAPRKRIQGLVLENTNPENRSEQEIAGYRDALALVHESAQEMDFSTGVIRQLHTMMYRYLPQPGGEWKPTDNEIIERNPDGTRLVRFRPVSAVGTPQAIEDLTRGFERAIHTENRPGLIVAPLAVLDFLCIHPFTDGNGRASRLLTLQLLYKMGHEVGRFISLERVIEESKETYYEALKLSSEGWHEGDHDPHPWLDYFWGVLIRAYGEFSDRVGTLNRGPGGKAAQVRRAIEKMNMPFSLSELQSECPGISLPTIKRELGAMKDEGLVMLTGRGRGAKWKRLG